MELSTRKGHRRYDCNKADRLLIQFLSVSLTCIMASVEEGLEEIMVEGRDEGIQNQVKGESAEARAPVPSGPPVNEVPPKMGFFAKLINIFVEPSSVFKNIYYHNDWLTPLVFGTVITVISGVLAMGYSQDARAQFNELMGVGAQSSAGNIAAIGQYAAIVLSPFSLMFGWLIGAAIIFVLGTFMLENVDFKKLYSIVAFAWLPTAFTGLISAIYSLSQTPIVASYDDFIDAMIPWTISLGRILPLEGIAGRLISVYDIFAVWSWWLLILGITYGLRNRKSQSITVTVVYIIIGLLIAIGAFALQAKFRPPGM